MQPGFSRLLHVSLSLLCLCSSGHAIALETELHPPILNLNGEETSYPNHSFTYFGLGMENINYREDVTVLGKYDISLDLSVTNPMQRSGGYSAINKNWGFYITTASTLAVIPADEQWNISGFGSVQTDEVTFSWNELNVLGAYLYKPGHQITGGINYTNFTFTRYNFKFTDNSAALENDMRLSLGDPNASSGTRDCNPATDGNDWFCTPGGAVTEDVTAVVLLGGYRYDSFLTGEESHYRWQFAAQAGLPLYYRVLNSSFPEETFSSNFGGYDVALSGGFGWHLRKDIDLLTTLDWNYKHRNKHEGDAAVLPTNSIQSLRLALVASWTF